MRLPRTRDVIRIMERSFSILSKLRNAGAELGV